MNEKITLKKLAQLTGVNRSTVSRVLNPKPGYVISDAVREKILKAAAEYRYVQNSAAQGLSSGRSMTLGIVLGQTQCDFASPFFSQVLTGFCAKALELKYRPIIFSVDSGDQDSEVSNHIFANNADGYFIGANISGAKTAAALIEKQLPAIIYNADRNSKRQIPSARNFKIDTAEAQKKLCHNLFAKGIRDCVVIESPLIPNRTDILNVSKCKLSIRCRLSFEYSLNEFHCRALSNVFAKKHFAALTSAPMIFAPNDLIALGICEYMEHCGLEPGRDFFIAGCDNIEENPIYQLPGSYPKLTTIDMDFLNCGRLIASELVAACQENTAPLDDFIHHARLIERHSTDGSVKSYECAKRNWRNPAGKIRHR